VLPLLDEPRLKRKVVGPAAPARATQLRPSNACRNDNKNANRLHQSQPIVHFKTREVKKAFAGHYAPIKLSALAYPQRAN